MLASIVSRPGTQYPEPDEFFSPSEAYPEYRHGHLARKPNPVYAMVREVFAQSSLDRANFGTSAWNPLGQYIKPGNKVFLLCNFVHHRRRTESAEDFLGKCTHGSVVRAVIDYVLIALESRKQKAESKNRDVENGKQDAESGQLDYGTTGRPDSALRTPHSAPDPGSPLPSLISHLPSPSSDQGRVIFGNAPLQSCDFERVLQETGAAAVREFYAQRHLPVESKDLRLFVTERAASGRTTRTIVRDQSEGVPVVLDDQSLLHEFDPAPSDVGPLSSDVCRQTSESTPAYRVADYDPEFMRDWHDHRKHRYFIHRSILESDVILCVPKLKTHEKVGITCALKGYVGIVGRKECLPHHRFGPPAKGGDEYPNGNPLLLLHSWLGDWVNRKHGKADISTFYFLLSALENVSYHTLGRVLRRLGCVTSGAWHGNDTTWRMALDLARIAHFADRDGKLKDKLQRPNLAFMDGIVGGEGEGPLSPKAVASGCLFFSDDVALEDEVACRLMGFPPEMLPVVREAFIMLKPRQAGAVKGVPLLSCNGCQVEVSALKPALGRPFLRPRGWKLPLRVADDARSLK